MMQFTRAACRLPVLLGLAIAVAGCDSKSPTEPNDDAATSGGATTTADSDPTGPAANTVKLELVNRAGFDAKIAEHQGKVVLVDFWATWCEPCKERLPHMFDLLRDHQPRGLTLITMSCDDPAARDSVADFLTEQKAFEAVNLLTSLDINETFETYDIPGGIPHYLAYDRTGKLRYRFNLDPQEGEGTTSANEIDEKIAQLLSEDAPSRLARMAWTSATTEHATTGQVPVERCSPANQPPTRLPATTGQVPVERCSPPTSPQRVFPPRRGRSPSSGAPRQPAPNASSRHDGAGPRRAVLPASNEPSGGGNAFSSRQRPAAQIPAWRGLSSSRLRRAFVDFRGGHS